ncbi:MAG: MFS transporter [Oscillatoria princeps RMCB-10]|jgi:predicted MFS family arabinose efflux permease|nr:MFS transporter [Oscillatoria princeps RMCB-10]
MNQERPEFDATEIAHSSLQPHTIWMMAITSGAAAANVYYNQPLLATIAQSFHAPAHATGLIPTLTQIGYAIGIFLLVPLGDLLERRRLIITMLGLTAIALAAVAISPNLTWLGGASLVLGITTITPQLIVPFAANLAKPQERGRVVGSVMSGLLVGILLARTVSGFVGASLGWQAIYWLASGLMILLTVAIVKTIPKSHPSLRMSYPRLMASLLQIIRVQSVLRETSLIGAMSFGAFSAFWSTLAFLLTQPPYQYGSEVAGLFGLVGVAGIAAANFVGKLADKTSPKRTVGLGLATTTLAFLVFWCFGHQISGLIAGVILLDLGVQTTLVSNQARIYNLPLEFHSRLNALFITFYFVGGALGAFLGAYGWSYWQWSGVCTLAILMLGIAFTTFLKGTRQTIEL